MLANIIINFASNTKIGEIHSREERLHFPIQKAFEATIYWTDHRMLVKFWVPHIQLHTIFLTETVI